MILKDLQLSLLIIKNPLAYDSLSENEFTSNEIQLLSNFTKNGGQKLGFRLFKITGTR